jgi:hypothetical protein
MDIYGRALTAFNSFFSDTVSLGFILYWFYLFVSVLCESVFVYGFLVGRINFVLVFSLWLVNDMERGEGLGRKLFYKKSTSHEALKLPVENVSTEISRGTLSSHPVSRYRNLCFSLFFNIFWLYTHRSLMWISRGVRVPLVGPAV